jgi:hypothetical protein
MSVSLLMVVPVLIAILLVGLLVLALFLGDRRGKP